MTRFLTIGVAVLLAALAFGAASGTGSAVLAGHRQSYPETHPWPDVATAMQGEFWASSNATVISVAGNQVVLRARNQFPDWSERLPLGQAFFTVREIAIANPYTANIRGSFISPYNEMRPTEELLQVTRARHDGSIGLRFRGTSYYRPDNAFFTPEQTSHRLRPNVRSHGNAGLTADQTRSASPPVSNTDHDRRRHEVEAEVARLGPHRRAEAERNVDLRLRAEAARQPLTGMCRRGGNTIENAAIGQTAAIARERVAAMRGCQVAGGSSEPGSCAPTGTGFIRCTATVTCPIFQAPCGSTGGSRQ